MDRRAEVIDYIKQNFMNGEGRELQADQDLFALGVIDSFGMVELITGLEQKFGVAFTAEELSQENLQSAAAIAGLIARKEQ